MSKAENDFISDMFADIKIAEEKAEVIKDTQVINFKPQWGDKVTAESLATHVDFINKQGAIVSAATSNIGFAQFPDTKIESWTGIMDLGAMQITAQSHIRETYEMGDDKKEHDYGITDLIFDYRHSPELNEFYDHFTELDHARCKGLFEE